MNSGFYFGQIRVYCHVKTRASVVLLVPRARGKMGFSFLPEQKRTAEKKAKELNFFKNISWAVDGLIKASF